MMCREHMSTDSCSWMSSTWAEVVLADVRRCLLQAKDKLTAFQSVCENFRPVMHHFFLEKFAQAANWFEKRLAYTRSVATSSMVGYIVGLGDRHSVNILMDQATAEVVHIDLGVAFEQGLMLKTPERVPFRLTRDIVDGMGVTGVEGVFRRVCEATLSVLRENKEALLTIVEVKGRQTCLELVVGFVALHANRLFLVDQLFICIKGDPWNVKTSVVMLIGTSQLTFGWRNLQTPFYKHVILPQVFIYDPLYNWALSPLKALQRQQELDDLDDSLPESDNMAEMEGNKDAARALFRVKQKLDGYEEGEMRSLQGQVSV
ncbi:hypothetical protein Mapa_012833 [Marchantia paleacea]|nr:hypothetical protein Mapa_012833 [Marchantia paleacea]